MAHEQLSGITHSFTAGQPQNVTFGYSRDADERRMADTVSTAAFLWHPPAAGTTAYTPNTLDQYAEIDEQALTYNADADLTGDPAAPLANAAYNWDFKNRLTHATNAQHNTLYQYDALDRRSQKTLDGVTTVYVWDGQRMIAAYTNKGVEVQHWVYGVGAAPILAESFSGGTAPTALAWHHADALGSTVALTNSTGQLTAKLAYSPWGEGSLAGATAFGFAGMLLDTETGLYYDHARYYSPAQGRFVSPDPIGVEGGINIYAYAENDPVNATDLSGLDSADEGYGQGPIPNCEGGCPAGTPPEQITVTANPANNPNFSARDLGIGQGGSPGPDSTTTEEITVYAKKRHPSVLQCIGTCTLQQYVPGAIGLGLAGLGAPVLPKPKFPGAFGASRGTSPASVLLRQIFPNKLGYSLLGTRVLGGMMGRFVPFLGYGLLAYDLGSIGVCSYRCAGN